METHENTTKAILQALQAGERLTKWEMFHRFNTVHGGSMIFELRKKGYGIKTTMVKFPSGKRGAVYHMEPQSIEPIKAADTLQLELSGSVKVVNDFFCYLDSFFNKK